MSGKRFGGSEQKVVTKVDEHEPVSEENKLLKENVSVEKKVKAKEGEDGKNTGKAEKTIEVEGAKGTKVSGDGSRKRKGSSADSKSSTSIMNAPTKTAKNTKDKKKAKICIEDCVKGARSGCTIKMRRRKEGHLSCVEVHEMLVSMGVKDPSQTSKCVRAAIMKGHIKITGNPEEMEMIIFEDKCKYAIVPLFHGSTKADAVFSK